MTERQREKLTFILDDYAIGRLDSLKTIGAVGDLFDIPAKTALEKEWDTLKQVFFFSEDKYVAAAVDADGSLYLYEEISGLRDDELGFRGERFRYTGIKLELIAQDWKNSIIKK